MFNETNMVILTLYVRVCVCACACICVYVYVCVLGRVFTCMCMCTCVRVNVTCASPRMTRMTRNMESSVLTMRGVRMIDSADTAIATVTIHLGLNRDVMYPPTNGVTRKP
jgi:hypothetical protein